jgi:LysM repeat protein
MKIRFSLFCALGLLGLTGGLSAAQHTVTQGDTLTALSRKYGVSVAEIRAANGLGDDNIQLGRALKIPKPVGKAQPAGGTGGPIQVRRAQPVDPRQKPLDRPDREKPVKAKSTGSYTVQSGDSLSKLAARYGTSVAALKAANGIEGEGINIGQALVIPQKGSAPPKATPAPAPEKKPVAAEPPPKKPAATAAPANKGTGVEHFVLEGDRLSILARRYGVSVDSIRSANSLDGDFIRVGQLLVIPTKNAPAPAAEAPAAPPQTALDKLAKATPGAKSTPNVPAWERPEHYLDLVDLSAPTAAPEVEKPAVAAPEPEPPAKPAPARASYEVQDGDSLWKIARQQKVSIDQLRTANGLKDDSIQIGQKLVVP